MRVLGVDPGGKRLGLAVGDDETGVVTPLQVAPYDGVEAACRLIDAAAREHGAKLVVLGLPTDVDGERTPACRRTERLAEGLGALGVEVRLQAEYLTTAEARSRARQAGRDPREPVDHLAAQIILEEFLGASR
jgi:putative Holliday junction resolvase